MQNKFKFSLALVGALMAAPLVHADEASLGGEGGNLYVESNEFVQMQSEVITIDIYPSQREPAEQKVNGPWTLETKKNHRGFAEFEIEYTFVNHSEEPVEVLMGFPETGQGFEGESDLQEFEALYWDGTVYQSIDVEYVEAEDYRDPNWYTKTFIFEPGETKILNRYWALPSAYKGPERGYNYVLETGDSWRGVIESAEVNVQLHDGLELHDLLDVNPRSDFTYYFDENRFSWLFEDLEPTSEDNLYLSVKDPNDGGFVCENFPQDSVDYASSTFPALNDSIHYYPCAIRDNDVRSAWVEDNLEGGFGEWVEFYFPRNGLIYEYVDVFAGYGWDEEAWQENARPSVLRFDLFEYRDESLEPALSFDLDLEDVYGIQRITLPDPIVAMDYGYARIEILDYVQGTEYPHDVALSEVEFIGYLDEYGESSYYADPYMDYSLAVDPVEELIDEVLEQESDDFSFEKSLSSEKDDLLDEMMDSVFNSLRILFVIGFVAVILLIALLVRRQKNKAL